MEKYNLFLSQMTYLSIYDHIDDFGLIVVKLEVDFGFANPGKRIEPDCGCGKAS